MKTKLLILTCLLTFNIILAATPKKEAVKESKPVIKMEVNLTEEFNRLDKLAEKTEKSLIYKAN